MTFLYRGQAGFQLCYRRANFLETPAYRLSADPLHSFEHPLSAGSLGMYPLHAPHQDLDAVQLRSGFEREKSSEMRPGQ
jgi:hypothetical protein